MNIHKQHLGNGRLQTCEHLCRFGALQREQSTIFNHFHLNIRRQMRF
ncbi:Uncharacterised protein [Vibrio cholerae]|nr:Uncharacterised protein [Vibrio cholerae]